MTKVKFSARAFCKIILHATKYPHCAVNGVLLAKPSASFSKEIEFVDVVPLFHICINLTPMAEIALMQIDELASSMGLTIAGYYAANENLKDNTFEKAHHKISEKIAINSNPSYLVVINNTKLSLDSDASALKVSQISEGNIKHIDEGNVSLTPSEGACEALMVLQQKKAHQGLVDFDNHLDDISLDWMNAHLNKSIEEYL
ncbi:ER membrane protein complex subunit 8/9 homolog [Euwallacea fornicatus]|uniref:ER membrane protein complex subunit 8/9 homolog n=1 Tax=Euwallacea fornicatus TaxID=995702 RepID=UPI00338F5275